MLFKSALLHNTAPALKLCLSSLLQEYRYLARDSILDTRSYIFNIRAHISYLSLAQYLERRSSRLRRSSSGMSRELLIPPALRMYDIRRLRLLITGGLSARSLSCRSELKRRFSRRTGNPVTSFGLPALLPRVCRAPNSGKSGIARACEIEHVRARPCVW